MVNRKGGNNQRLAQLLGMLTKNKNQPVKANCPSYDRSRFSAERYQFLLWSPFEVSNRCCNVMKKSPNHQYQRETGRKPITAQMASESRLRKQKWLQLGCNAYNAKYPISNPMSFWTEQDVLQYIKEFGLTIAKPYGKIVEDLSFSDNVAGQLTMSDIPWVTDTDYDAPKCPLKTSLCSRTGCIFCGFGITQDPTRFSVIDRITGDSKLRDYCLRGGAFCRDGLWRPKGGLGLWFVLKYINLIGGFEIEIPEYDRYEKEYGNEKTHAYLYEGKRWTPRPLDPKYTKGR